MALNKQQVADLYRRRAKRYDFTAQLYYLAGFRQWAYRKKAVDALSLAPGDAVVELGCGTGLNFALLKEKVGPQGKIIGVDLTDAMLAGARKRIHRNRWSNIELVQCDAATFRYPATVDGIISTFALTLVPEYETVIQAGAAALKPGGCFVILDMKWPVNWPSCLLPLILPTVRPFGVTIDLANRHPWDAMNQCLPSVSVKEYYFGLIYIAVGKRGRF